MVMIWQMRERYQQNFQYLFWWFWRSFLMLYMIFPGLSQKIRTRNYDNIEKLMLSEWSAPAGIDPDPGPRGEVKIEFEPKQACGTRLWCFKLRAKFIESQKIQPLALYAQLDFASHGRGPGTDLIKAIEWVDVTSDWTRLIRQPKGPSLSSSFQ